MDELERFGGDALVPVTSPGDRNPALVYLSSLAASGRRTMAGKLLRVARMIGYPDIVTPPWHLMRYQHVVAIRTRLQEEGLAPSTVNSTLFALRGVARACFNLELTSAEDLLRIRDVRPIRHERLPAGRAVTPGELAAMMDACAADESAAGVRDAAIIALLYALGVRRQELVSLDVESYDPETGEAVILGKLNRQRKGFIDNGAADALADWLLLLGESTGPLFVPITRGGHLVRGRRLSSQAVYDALKRRAREAGVRDVRCHDMRRSFVSDLLAAGVDASLAAKLAGNSLQVIGRYDKRGDEAKKRAVALLHVPYRRRESLPPD
jgi:integrase